MDIGAEVGKVHQSHKIMGGLPFTLGENVAYANVGVDVFGGTLDNIEQLSVKELNGVPAELHILMAKKI